MKSSVKVLIIDENRMTFSATLGGLCDLSVRTCSYLYE